VACAHPYCGTPGWTPARAVAGLAVPVPSLSPQSQNKTRGPQGRRPCRAAAGRIPVRGGFAGWAAAPRRRSSSTLLLKGPIARLGGNRKEPLARRPRPPRRTATTRPLRLPAERCAAGCPLAHRALAAAAGFFAVGWRRARARRRAAREAASRSPTARGGGARPAERLPWALPPPFPAEDGVGGIPPASRSLAATWQAAFAAQRTVPTTGSRERPPNPAKPGGKGGRGRGIGGRRPSAPRPDRRPRRCCFASTGERRGGAGGRRQPYPSGGDQGRPLVRGYTAGILDRHSGGRPCLPFLLAPIDRRPADRRAERSAGPQMPACPARLPAVGAAGAGCFPRPGRLTQPKRFSFSRS